MTPKAGSFSGVGKGRLAGNSLMRLLLEEKGNSLSRHLHGVDVTPSDCTFEMIAIGPIFPEQNDFESHKPYRKKTSALEAALAGTLRARGYTVFGVHGRRVAPNPELYAQVKDHIAARFPHLGTA